MKVSSSLAFTSAYGSVPWPTEASTSASEQWESYAETEAVAVGSDEETNTSWG